MKKFITNKHIVIFFSITFLLIAGIIVFWTILKNNENNRTLAQIEFDLLMFQIENKIINLNTLSDSEYIEIGYKVVSLINIIGKIKSIKEHYFRVKFSRAPETLDEMTRIIIEKDNNLFGWKLVSWQNTAFHMYGKDGEYNLKFISADGHFEAVYDREGTLLTEDNDPLNMGTFNYARQLADQMAHYNLDVWPYFMWNNTAEAVKIMETKDTEKTKPAPVDKNEKAMNRYKEYENLLNISGKIDLLGNKTTWKSEHLGRLLEMNKKQEFDCVKFKYELQEKTLKKSGAKNLREYAYYANEVAKKSSLHKKRNGI